MRAVAERDGYANLILPAMIRDARLAPRDAAFATELTYGRCVAGEPTTPSSPGSPAGHWPTSTPRCWTRSVGGTPDPPDAGPGARAVSATVDLVRAEIGPGAAGFANAVLRG